MIDEHKENYQEDVDGGGEDSRDFIDAFLAEMKREGAHESFEELQLLVRARSTKISIFCLCHVHEYQGIYSNTKSKF